MGQTWTSDIYEPGTSYSNTMLNIRTNFATLRTMFSGVAAPTSPVTGMPWFDSSKYSFKIRNNANDAWIGIFCGSALHKTYFYSNSAIEGWVVDLQNMDRVLGIRGGNVYLVGGTLAGDWNLSGLSVPHCHTVASHTHTITDGSHHHLIDQYGDGWGDGYQGFSEYTSYSEHTHTVSSESPLADTVAPTVRGSSWRLAVRVFTMQYIDI